MAVSYDILQGLKPSHFVDAKQVDVCLPYHLAEKHKNLGVKPVMTITLTGVPCKGEVLEKINEYILTSMQKIPGLRFEHFWFKLVGGFCGPDYI